VLQNNLFVNPMNMVLHTGAFFFYDSLLLTIVNATWSLKAVQEAFLHRHEPR